jgi:hypothetical protein
MKANLVTEITGCINGSSYIASGTGYWNGIFSDSSIVFKKEIIGFSPKGRPSWKCKHHKSLSPLSGRENPFSFILNKGHAILATGTMSFPGNHGLLLISAEIKRKDGIQFITQSCSGFYDGPIDVVKPLDYEHLFTLTTAGTVSMSSTELVLLSDGSQMPILYKWEYKIPVLSNFEPFKVNYHLRHVSYKNKVFRISVLPKAFALNESPVLSSRL